MAKRTSRLTPLAESITENNAIAGNTAVDRRREQLDDARAGGPGSTDQQAAEGADVSVLDTDTGGKGTGLEGSAADFFDAARAEREAARDPNPDADEPVDPNAGLFKSGTESAFAGGGASPTTGSDSGGVGDASSLTPEQGERIAAARGFTPDNPAASGAPADPFAKIASSGVRGTESATPAAEGFSGVPSVEDGSATVSFARNLDSRRQNIGAGPEGANQSDGSVVFEGKDGTKLTVTDDTFVVVGDDTTTAGVIVDGTFGTSTVDNKTGEEIFGFARNNSGTLDTTTVKKDDGTVISTTTETQPGSTTTTTTETAPTTTTPVGGGVGLPAEDSPRGLVPRTVLSPTGTGGRGGDIDPTDDPVFEASPGAEVPDLKDKLLGDDNLDPDFGGGGGGATPNPGADSQGAGSVTPTDDAADPLSSGLEDDPLDGGTEPLEPSANEGTDGSADLIVPGLTAVIDNSAAIPDDVLFLDAGDD